MLPAVFVLAVPATARGRARSTVARLRLRLRRESGYSMIEMVVVLAIMGSILGALTTTFVSATNAEVTLNQRFQAETQVVVALDVLRRDVHCASAIAPTGASASITLTMPSACGIASGLVTWCTSGSGTRYGLYRSTSSTCNSSQRLYADYLTAGSVFNYTAPVAGASLGSLNANLSVQVGAADTLYRVTDNIVLRNTSR